MIYIFLNVFVHENLCSDISTWFGGCGGILRAFVGIVDCYFHLSPLVYVSSN